MDEKKKTQGMRRDLAHFCGVFIHHHPIFLLHQRLFSSTHPHFTTALLLPPSIYFSKKAEKAARKNFSGRKGKKKTATEEQKNRRNKRNKSGVEEKKKTQGMRRDLGHKGCGWVNNHTPCASKAIHFCEFQNKYFDENTIS